MPEAIVLRRNDGTIPRASSLRGYCVTWGIAVFIATAIGCQRDRVSSVDPSQQPNVILIVIDTLRKDHLGCYGYDMPTSPHIDALAEVGWTYENCFSQAPWTTPSVASLLTSRYPSELQIRNVPNQLKDEFVLLSEVLQEAGYTTGAVISHSFLNRKWNFDQGFEFFSEENILGADGVTAPGVTQVGLEFLAENKDNPFFLFLHYFDPHANYILHGEYDFTKGLDYKGSLISGMPLRTLMDMRKEVNEEDLAFLLALYDSEIAFTDRYTGIVLDRLKEYGLFENSLIILTSDHGEEFLERGWFGHAKSLYNELINVPLIIKYPGGGGGKRVEENTALVDLFPTVMDTTHTSLPYPVRGISLHPDATVPQGSTRLIYSETSRLNELRAAIQGPWKLIYSLKKDTLLLVNFRSNPKETEDFASQDESLKKNLEGSLRKWMQECEQDRWEPSNVVIDEREQEMFRALGYLR